MCDRVFNRQRHLSHNACLTRHCWRLRSAFHVSQGDNSKLASLRERPERRTAGRMEKERRRTFGTFTASLRVGSAKKPHEGTFVTSLRPNRFRLLLLWLTFWYLEVPQQDGSHPRTLCSPTTLSLEPQQSGKIGVNRPCYGRSDISRITLCEKKIEKILNNTNVSGGDEVTDRKTTVNWPEVMLA